MIRRMTMRTNRHDPIAVPVGHVQQPGPDIDTPAVTRRDTAQLGRDLAVSAGVPRWEDVPDEIRREMREAMIMEIMRRLEYARRAADVASLTAGADRDSAIADVERRLYDREVRLERALAAARRLT